jgi:hypothetical protein
MREIPVTTRNSKSPAPGQPRAKVENRRRTQTPWQGYAIFFPVRNPRNGPGLTLLSLKVQ